MRRAARMMHFRNGVAERTLDTSPAIPLLHQVATSIAITNAYEWSGLNKCAYRTRRPTPCLPCGGLPLHRPHSGEVRTHEEACRALRSRIRARHAITTHV